MDFFEEFKQLKLSAPRCALFNIAGQNSDYCAYARYNKNCYLCVGNDYDEDCYYGYWLYHNKDCTDCSYIYESELLYDCVDCRKCYGLDFCQDCQGCNDSWFLYNCHGCKNCYGCVNLKQGEFFIFNKKFPREEYLEEVKKYKARPITEQKAAFAEFLQKHPRVFMHQLQNADCAGDYVYNSKNSYACYDAQSAQDCIYAANTIKTKDCTDVNFMYQAELCYECVSTEGFNCNFTYVCWECSDLEFCELCFNSKNCFGCIGLKHKEFHILNKPYTPEEYHKKVAEIKADLRSKGQYNGTLPEVFFEG
ncbi:MAG: hypothetical protein WCT53_03945 [Candidatus Gracilibacteria bacterium]